MSDAASSSLPPDSPDTPSALTNDLAHPVSYATTLWRRIRGAFWSSHEADNVTEATKDVPKVKSTDPLGYDAYAKTLWDRIDHALNRDATTGKLGDDPLVVGLFGEWGVGKTYLLEKIRDRAITYGDGRAVRRRSDGGFGLTIPVYFQPWKYEHEEHLHVPLLLHTLKALEEGVKIARTSPELMAQAAQAPGDAIIQSLPKVVAVFKKLVTAAVVVMAPVSGVALAVAQSVAEKAAKPKPKKLRVADDLKYADNGNYFYQIHEILKAITRPALHAGYLPDIVIVNKNFAVNFVVFVDDLDRCLPEKAVQVLELIKTVFNVESFAFVLALDDEVIERGIGHRYKDYAFENKKQHMPITGFEYLEKIVHLPFRLPALTEKQAIAFVRDVEKRVDPEGTPHQPRTPQHWFAELGAGSPIAYRERNDEPGLAPMPGATDDPDRLEKGGKGGAR